MTTTADTTDRLATLRDRYLVLAARIKTDEDELEQIKAAIRDAAPVADTYDVGDGSIVISASRRFNEKKALPLIPEPLRAFVIRDEPKVDAKALAALAPEVFEQAHDIYKNRVSVR